MLGSLVLGLEEDDESPESERGEPPAGFEAELREAFPEKNWKPEQIRAFYRAMHCCEEE